MTLLRLVFDTAALLQIWTLPNFFRFSGTTNDKKLPASHLPRKPYRKFFTGFKMEAKKQKWTILRAQIPTI